MVRGAIRGGLYGPDDLWRIDDPTNPGAAVLLGSFPSGLTAPVGIASRGVGPCMIRVARGTTEIESLELDDGRILFDATFVDAPPVGTHTYSLQMRTADWTLTPCARPIEATALCRCHLCSFRATTAARFPKLLSARHDTPLSTRCPCSSRCKISAAGFASSAGACRTVGRPRRRSASFGTPHSARMDARPGPSALAPPRILDNS